MRGLEKRPRLSRDASVSLAGAWGLRGSGWKEVDAEIRNRGERIGRANLPAGLIGHRHAHM